MSGLLQSDALVEVLLSLAAAVFAFVKSSEWWTRRKADKN